MKTLKSVSFLALSLCLFAAVSFAQKTKPRPAGTKPTTTAKVPAKAVSPAEQFFNDGLKCEAKDFDCQVSNYTKAINLGLASKEVFKNRGNAYLLRKDFDKALGDFTKLIELDPNDTSGYKNRGRIYFEISTSPQAANAAIKDFTSAIDLEPKDVEALKLRSSAYLKLKNFEKAKVDMDKITAIEPNNIDVIIGQAQMLLDTEQYDGAVEAYGKALTIKPTASIYIARGNAYLTRAKYELAVADFSKAIELDPKNADNYDARGKAYMQSGKMDLAKSDINKAIDIDPKRKSSLVNLAKSLEKQKDYDGAIKIYDLILTSASKDEETQYLYNRGWLSVLKQDPKQTIADATRLIELSPKNAKAIELRCMAFVQLKEYQSAIDECTDAIELDPTLEYAFSHRGIATYSITGKMEGSAQSDLDKGYTNQIASSNKILSQIPDDFDSLVKRAAAYMGTKNYAASAQDYKKLIELYPHHEDAYSLLSSVSSLANGITVATIPSNRAESYRILTQGISANPDSVTLYYSRGANYDWEDHRNALNDYLKAVENFKKKANPNASEKIYARIAISQAANKYHFLKDDAAAVSTINVCDELFPDSLDCLKSKGDLYNGQLKAFGKAIEPYTKLIELYPSKKSAETTVDVPNAIYSLAEAYFGLNDKSNAIATINRGLSQFSENKHMWDYAAMFYQYKLKDTSKATEYYAKSAQLGSTLGQMSLGQIAEEKQRRKERRNSTILSIMGAVNQGLETYNNNRRTSQVSQPTPRPPTTNTPSGNGSSGASAGTTGSVKGCTPNDGTSRSAGWSSCAVEAGEVGALFAGTVVSDPGYGPYDWNECSQPDMDGYKRCWGGWMQSGLSQVSFRLRGPFHSTNSFKEPYYWTVGFKNNTNGIVSFSPRLIFGDGTDASHNIIILPPGAEYQWSAGATASSSATASLQMPKWAYCPNASRAGGGYRCN